MFCIWLYRFLSHQFIISNPFSLFKKSLSYGIGGNIEQILGTKSNLIQQKRSIHLNLANKLHSIVLKFHIFKDDTA